VYYVVELAYAMNQQNFEWTRDFWQGWRESTNPFRQYKSQRDRQLVLKALHLRDGERLLEVGCGYGWISRALWDAANIEWFGVDRSPEMVSQLRTESSKQSHHALLADACQLPYRDGEFDKVICTGVLMHIREDIFALRELIRVLRPGGLLVCSINNALSPYSLLVRIWNSRKTRFVQKFRIPASFRRILKEAGVQSEEMVGDGIVATVPIAIGPLHFPPVTTFSAVSKLDERVTDKFPWLAYEVWFTAVKDTSACVS
jgi:ubiquinone/menaquinone biosynthesis C-methylase UbiE